MYICVRTVYYAALDACTRGRDFRMLYLCESLQISEACSIPVVPNIEVVSRLASRRSEGSS